MTRAGREVLKAGVRDVVRDGDRVLRTPTRAAAGVQDLLRHLEAAGFDGSPRFLGFDAAGNEVLTYMEGTACAKPYVAAFLTNEGCVAIGALVRRAHEASRHFEPSPQVAWLRPNPRPDDDTVMCHGDLHPANIIFRGDVPVGLIDWDLASPAPPLRDLAYLAWRLAPLRNDAWARNAGFNELPDRAARLQSLVSGYGRFTPIEVVNELVLFFEDEERLITERGARGQGPWDALLRDSLHQTLARERQWVEANGAAFA